MKFGTGGVTGVILAGGEGRRMDYAEKGLMPLKGRALVWHALQRLRPQVDHVMINANRAQSHYAAFAAPLIADLIGPSFGPLAGIVSGLHASYTPLTAFVPCDAPFFPDDLVARLFHALGENDSDIAVARSPASAHPVFCLMKSHLAGAAYAYLLSGNRRVNAFHAQQRAVFADFDDDAPFLNINTPHALEQASALIPR